MISCGATRLDAFAPTQCVLTYAGSYNGKPPVAPTRLSFGLPSQVHSVILLLPRSQRLRLSVSFLTTYYSRSSVLMGLI